MREREREREQERNLELRKLQPSIHFPFPFPRVRTEKLLPRNQLRSRARRRCYPDPWCCRPGMNYESAERGSERSCKFNFGVQIHYSSAASPDLKSCNGKTDTCSYVIRRQILCCWELGLKNQSRPNKSACSTQNLSPHIENSISTFLLQFWQKMRTAFFPIWHRTTVGRRESRYMLQCF